MKPAHILFYFFSICIIYIWVLYTRLVHWVSALSWTVWKATLPHPWKKIPPVYRTRPLKRPSNSHQLLFFRLCPLYANAAARPSFYSFWCHQSVCMHILGTFGWGLARDSSSILKWVSSECPASVAAAYTGSISKVGMCSLVRTGQRLPGRSEARQMGTQTSTVILEGSSSALFSSRMKWSQRREDQWWGKGRTRALVHYFFFFPELPQLVFSTDLCKTWHVLWMKCPGRQTQTDFLRELRSFCL